MNFSMHSIVDDTKNKESHSMDRAGAMPSMSGVIAESQRSVRNHRVNTAFIKYKARGPKARPGDVFCLQHATGKHIPGRVIAVSHTMGDHLFAHCLIYMYKLVLAELPEHESIDKKCTVNALLLPPLLVFPQMFTSGLAKIIGNRELLTQDTLTQHCFHDWAMANKECYVDECGNRLPHRIEPCGEYGVHGRGALEFVLNEALESLADRQHTRPDPPTE